KGNCLVEWLSPARRDSRWTEQRQRNHERGEPVSSDQQVYLTQESNRPAAEGRQPYRPSKRSTNALIVGVLFLGVAALLLCGLFALFAETLEMRYRGRTVPGTLQSVSLDA